MKKKINISKSFWLAILVMATTLLSCSKWDEYKQYSDAGETKYSGKIDSVKIYPGNKRARIKGLMNADPKIATIKVFWNNNNDSAVFDAKTSVVNNVFDQVISVPESMANFTVYTYDASGNRSVPVFASATIYGDVYQNTLSNRLVAAAELLNTGSVKIDWAEVNANAGVIGVQILYADVSNANRDTTIMSASATAFSTMLPGYKAGTKFQYRTLYKPVPTAIDTFYTGYAFSGVKADITSLYIKNAGAGIISTPASGTDRWRIPQDWIVTDDVKNAGGLGGLDAGGWLPSQALSIEAWWGMPEIPNGKIYQTVTLPAGKYAFTATTGDCSDGATKYITAAAGSSLPDIAAVPGTALAFTNVVKWADNTIRFELTSPTQVALGIQASMKAEGNFMKVFQVRLYSLP